jgi:hypothetical protein
MKSATGREETTAVDGGDTEMLRSTAVVALHEVHWADLVPEAAFSDVGRARAVGGAGTVVVVF